MTPPAPADVQLGDADWQMEILEGAAQTVAMLEANGAAFDDVDDDGGDLATSCPLCHATSDDEAQRLCVRSDACPADDLGLFP